MAEYTTAHIVPITSPEWIPEREFIEDVLNHLGVTTIQGLIAYSKPRYWEDADDDDENYVFADWAFRKSMIEALDKIENLKACISEFFIFYNEWNHKITDSLTNNPIIEFTPDSLGVRIGPFNIPSPGYDFTIGRFCFELTVNGYGMPIDHEASLDAVRADPEVCDLLRYLEEKSGKKWSVFMSYSY